MHDSLNNVNVNVISHKKKKIPIKSWHIRTEELVNMRKPTLALVQIIGVHCEVWRRRADWSFIFRETLMHQSICMNYLSMLFTFSKKGSLKICKTYPEDVWNN